MNGFDQQNNLHALMKNANRFENFFNMDI